MHSAFAAQIASAGCLYPSRLRFVELLIWGSLVPSDCSPRDKLQWPDSFSPLRHVPSDRSGWPPMCRLVHRATQRSTQGHDRWIVNYAMVYTGFKSSRREAKACMQVPRKRTIQMINSLYKLLNQRKPSYAYMRHSSATILINSG
jgi:hypothetical protein